MDGWIDDDGDILNGIGGMYGWMDRVNRGIVRGERQRERVQDKDLLNTNKQNTQNGIFVQSNWIIIYVLYILSVYHPNYRIKKMFYLSSGSCYTVDCWIVRIQYRDFILTTLNAENKLQQ